MDAAGQVAQLGQGVLGVPVGGVDQLAGPGDVRRVAVVAELLPGHPQVHGQRDQPDLGAVVQVALDLAQQRGRVVHGQRPGLLQVADPLGQPARAEQPPRSRRSAATTALVTQGAASTMNRPAAKARNVPG